MGCVHAKCCCRYDASSEDDAGDTEGSTPRAIDGADALRHVLTQNALGSAAVPSHSFRLQYAFLTQRGHYPDSPDRENQDSFCIKTQLQGNPNLHFFGVFDGHGQFGTQCSNFVKERLVDILSADAHLLQDPVKGYNSAFQATNTQLHESDIDDSMSGTTAITVLVCGDSLFVANVGDSRAVAGVWNGNSVIAEDLSSDQTPFRKDEYERVKLCGARVLSVDQVEGIKDPNIQTWGDEENDEGDPPRLWVQNGMYPGTAFTRSVGDSTAEKIGVTADPEVLTVKITPDHLFFVVASDGVFEFLSSQTVINMVAKYADPRDACSAIAAESYRIWLEHETRTDDITIIIVHIKDICNPGTGVTDGGIRVNANAKASLLITEKTAERSVFSGSGICHARRGNSCDYQGPVDVPMERMERSTACVVPTPVHTISLRM
uniref:protein-serine/threonine phosphatase n=1 Tax=Anthurium amnicola TaxID=1678845 RepID=A0A1D1YWE7_9ARAE